VISALKATMIKGRKATVRRDKERTPLPPSAR
jgi:hypothetical protein